MKNIKVSLGDKFITDSGIWEVVDLKPGGKVELMNRKACRFMSRFTYQMNGWSKEKS